MSVKLIGYGLGVVGQPGDIDGPTSVASSNGLGQRNHLGARAFDDAGNEYIYLAGVASTLIYDAVTFNSASFATARLTANAVGPVAGALAAVIAGCWGWYQVYGNGTLNSDTVAGASGLYIDATDGRVDDAGVSGDWIEGLWSTAADATNLLPVFFDYPGVYNNAYLT